MLATSAQHLRRNFHTTLSRLVRGAGRRANPGVGYQLKELEDEGQLSQDPEGFGEMESDFMDVHRTHRQHESELVKKREKIRHIMIKQKYFRDQHLPNMLTYAEKEQMRLLHARNPEEWTAERLAESFPATAEIVEKILLAKWRAHSVKRIREHDEAVIRNWEQLRSGTGASVQLPAELKEHLLKFATRKPEDIDVSAAEALYKRTVLPKPKGHEFLSIITSCRKYADKEEKGNVLALKSGKAKTKNTTNLPASSAAADPDEETFLLSKVYDKRKMRLQELKQLKLSEAELKSSSSYALEVKQAELEQSAAAKLNNPFGTGIIAKAGSTHTINGDGSQLVEFNYAQKFESNEIVISTEDQKRYEMSGVKDRIHIPRKVWREGATYRVDDCYYDDDGELLYRVPGMTGKW